MSGRLLFIPDYKFINSQPRRHVDRQARGINLEILNSSIKLRRASLSLPAVWARGEMRCS